MKAILLSILMATAAVATAHPLPMTHYHERGHIVIGNQIKDTITTTYERDRNGNRVRVVTRTHCVDVGHNRRNNHLFCRHSKVTEQRFTDHHRGRRN